MHHSRGVELEGHAEKSRASHFTLRRIARSRGGIVQAPLALGSANDARGRKGRKRLHDPLLIRSLRQPRDNFQRRCRRVGWFGRFGPVRRGRGVRPNRQEQGTGQRIHRRRRQIVCVRWWL